MQSSQFRNSFWDYQNSEWADPTFDWQILESMPVTDEVERLLKILGPFYEMVDERRITQVSDLSTGWFLSLLFSPRIGLLEYLGN